MFLELLLSLYTAAECCIILMMLQLTMAVLYLMIYPLIFVVVAEARRQSKTESIGREREIFMSCQSIASVLQGYDEALQQVLQHIHCQFRYWHHAIQ
jgi:hypothetical protein